MSALVQTGRRVLGIDPGKVNCGWAVYGDDGLEDHGVMEGIDNVKRLDAFSEHFSNLFHIQNPDVCCIERYRNRPGKGSSLNMELVNLMIGSVWAFCKSEWVECYLVDPSAHKTWTSRNFEVGLSNKQVKGVVKKKYDLRTYIEWQGLPSEHEVDAANVAKYGHDYLLVKEK
jgi:hypothetical protein